MWQSINYPRVRRDEYCSDNYHGVQITDPYRWLEDPNSKETNHFVENQMKLTEMVLENDCGITPSFCQKIEDYLDFEQYTLPSKHGNKYFLTHNPGSRGQASIHSKKFLTSSSYQVFNPENSSDDGYLLTKTCSISVDGKFIAATFSIKGSDWLNVKIFNVEENQFENNKLVEVKLSNITWTNDSKGFFYCCYSKAKEVKSSGVGFGTNMDLNQEVYYHFLDSEQSEDILCWKDIENPEHLFNTDMTRDGKYLLLYISTGCESENKVYYLDLDALAHGLKAFQGGTEFLPFKKIVDTFVASYTLVTNANTLFTFCTNENAPMYKLVQLDLEKPNQWRDYLKELPENLLLNAQKVGENSLVLCYLTDMVYRVCVRNMKSGIVVREFLDHYGSFEQFSLIEGGFLVSYTDFLVPRKCYKCNVSEIDETEVSNLVLIYESKHKYLNKDMFEIEKVLYPSSDQTNIPMSIVKRKGISLDNSHPCLLNAYGAYGWIMAPTFRPEHIALLQDWGFIICLANIRGGGEYGEGWHKAGCLENKQNSFEDFIAAAQYLIREGYTQHKKLCIQGHSSGGLLVAACINQKPNLYGCALAHVGLMDMLRYHKFTTGHTSISEFGCSEREEEFNWLRNYSPLHNVKRPWEQSDENLQYPATLLLTADNDTRVPPFHTLKMLATMQYELCKSSEQTNPIIMWFAQESGHGDDRPNPNLISELSAQYGFMIKALDATRTIRLL